ncbi:metal ABC transporter solute-binding protein, Zn/Mn family, partial [Psittacicella gerlachiana]
KKTLLAITLGAYALINTAAADVLSSIKPIGFIVSDLTKDVTPSSVLIPATQSPHTVQLTPKDLATIKNTDLLIYIDDNMEISLGKALDNSRTRPKNVLALADIPEIKKLLVKGVHHDHDDHDHDHNHNHAHDHSHDHDHDHKHEEGHSHSHDHSHDHDHDHKHDDHHANDGLSTDYHIWNSPIIAKIIAKHIADKLIELYPNKKDIVLANLNRFNQELDKTNEEIKKLLVPSKMGNYYVYHSAYTYFETAYNFQDHDKGAIYFNVSIDPSVKDLNELNQKAKADNVKFIFTEPQFNQGIAQKLATSINAKLGVLDPLGVDIDVKPGSYQTYLYSLANSFSILVNK